MFCLEGLSVKGAFMWSALAHNYMHAASARKGQNSAAMLVTFKRYRTREACGAVQADHDT